MNEKEVAELRRRFRQDRSGISHVRGCYVIENREIVSQFDQPLGVMTQEENDAFQVLYQFGIFKGVGNYYMDPQGSTTRAQLAVLLHRLSVFVENQTV